MPGWSGDGRMAEEEELGVQVEAVIHVVGSLGPNIFLIHIIQTSPLYSLK